MADLIPFRRGDRSAVAAPPRTRLGPYEAMCADLARTGLSSEAINRELLATLAADQADRQTGLRTVWLSELQFEGE